ncbi:MAG: sulfide/dihydroorotate dehydrogenase-like FAD/NAD-binding protein [Candidatus Altiarchaeota archaeon]|nr:sulfide/dihydroorotate dehydrogenase-like FAD/NAD-binding protein [Candidatus Altiarchaeota archaeon]
MNEILSKEKVHSEAVLLEVRSPRIAQSYRPGQFIILRIHERGERIPLTVADVDLDAGSISLIFQEVGKSTKELASLEEGDMILDLLGPLGMPSKIRDYGTVVCVGGGIGVAPIYPIARALGDKGNKVVSVLGARCDELLFWRDRMDKLSDSLYVTTDDGSCGRKGFVTDQLRDLIDGGLEVNRVVAIGPLVMMSAVSELTREYGIETVVSLNPVMVDGTGMCGSCRVTVNGETRFACVDGPEFNAHEVDFNELFHRHGFYLRQEGYSLKRYLGGEGK